MSAQPPAPPPASPSLIELFPHVRIDLTASLIEIDATIALDTASLTAPVFLEVALCTPGTRDHESIALTRATPSTVHAALLMLGLNPGSPGNVAARDDRLIRTPPTGDAVTITLRWTDPQGTQHSLPLADAVARLTSAPPMRKDTPERPLPPFTSVPLAPQWRFAGSSDQPAPAPTANQADDDEFTTGPAPADAAPSVYAADISGTIIALTAFGDEVLALADPVSPHADLDEPAIIATPGLLPPAGTPVVITLAPAR